MKHESAALKNGAYSHVSVEMGSLYTYSSRAVVCLLALSGRAG